MINIINTLTLIGAFGIALFIYYIHYLTIYILFMFTILHYITIYLY